MDKILGLPVLASEHGREIDNLIIFVHWLMIVLFVGWLAYFAYALFRFRKSRHPRADYHAVQSHFSSYIEIAVAGVEGVLLLGLAIPYWARAVDKFPPQDQSTVIQVVAQQFAWNVRYPGKDGKFGKQEMRFVTPENVFGVDPADPTPLYAQLDRGIRAAIVAGRLSVGDRLPTVRQLAVELKINANTVAKVYAELERAGVLATQRGIGTFVRENPTLTGTATCGSSKPQ